MLSEKKTRRKSAYINFLSNEEPEEIKRFYSLKSIPSILGNNLFKEWIKEKFSSLLLKEEIPESRELSPLPENIIALVCDYFKVTNEQILMSRRGTENLPRDIAIYLVRLHSKQTLASIGQHFGIAKYSTVSSAVERIKLRMKHDRLLRKHLKKISSQTPKSQQQT